MDESDQDLVDRYRQGDLTAARLLYERHLTSMLRMVRARLRTAPNRSAYDSEGIVDDGFRSFFSAIAKPPFDTRKSNIAGFLATIVLRKCLVQLRRRQMLVTFDPENFQAIVDAALAVSAEPDATQQLVAQCNELIDAVCAEFTDLERAILSVYLNEEDCRTLAEIATGLHCSLAKVEATIKQFEMALKARIRGDQSADQ